MQITKDMTPPQALTQCLLLSLSAPTDEQAARAGALADKMAAGFNLSDSQIEICMADALEIWKPTGV